MAVWLRASLARTAAIYGLRDNACEAAARFTVMKKAIESWNDAVAKEEKRILIAARISGKDSSEAKGEVFEMKIRLRKEMVDGPQQAFVSLFRSENELGLHRMSMALEVVEGGIRGSQKHPLIPVWILSGSLVAVISGLVLAAFGVAWGTSVAIAGVAGIVLSVLLFARLKRLDHQLDVIKAAEKAIGSALKPGSNGKSEVGALPAPELSQVT